MSKTSLKNLFLFNPGIGGSNIILNKLKIKKKFMFDKTISPAEDKGLIIDLLLNKKRIKLPFTLIGGINHYNILNLSYLRPNNVAVVSSVWDYKNGPRSSAILFRKIMKDIYEN